MTKSLKNVIGIIIVIIYFSSLTMECFLVDGKPSISSFGLIAFLMGWLNFNVLAVIWLANPLFLISLFLFYFSRNEKLALILSLIATVLTFSFLLIGEIIKNEAGHFGQITNYLLGYWLWVISNLFLLIALIISKSNRL